MRFVCATAPDGGLFTTSVWNPVTGTEVRLSPPFHWDTWEQLDVFTSNFDTYCRVNYHFGHNDPAELDVSGWPTSVVDVATFRPAAEVS